MQLYYHKTDGGAEYLMDTFIECDNGHKEGTMNENTKYIIRIDGDITKEAELDVREEKTEYLILGDNNKWYATLETLKEVKQEMKRLINDYEIVDEECEELYIYEAKEIGRKIIK